MKYKNCLLIFVLSIASSHSFGLIRDYQTTRAISTAGAGVASILMVESLTLNPASSAFFNQALFYAQHNDGSLENRNSGRGAGDSFPLEPGGYMLAITDASSPKARGGLSYQKYEDNQTERTRYSLNMATAFSPSASIGFTYHYTNDEIVSGLEDKFHRGDFGFLYFFSQKFSLGVTAFDLGKSMSHTTTGTLGIQYVLSNHLLFLLDVGYNYHQSFSDTFFYKAAAQVKVFKDLGVRAGLFDDRNLNIKGGSWGINWNGPKFAIELAMSSFRAREILNNYLYRSEEIKEVSVSFTLKL